MRKLSPTIIAMCIVSCLSITSAQEPVTENMTVLAAENIRAGEIIDASDLATPNPSVELQPTILAALIGKEAKRSIYKNFPITDRDVKTPTIVERNAVINLEYNNGLLQAVTSVRALDSGGMGETIRVMNLSSKTIVMATIIDDGRARVQ
ncbi:MAG: flagellar basal body P-ring formation chaperone FlgA [Pseudomonadota bacterium]